MYMYNVQVHSCGFYVSLEKESVMEYIHYYSYNFTAISIDFYINLCQNGAEMYPRSTCKMWCN